MMSKPRDLLFISSSPEDRKYRDELLTHLDPQIRKGLKVWKGVEAGGDIARKRDDALAATRVAVLLLSADYMADAGLVHSECEPLVQAVKSDEVLLLWMATRPVEVPPSVAAFAPASPRAPSFAEMSFNDRQVVWVELAQKIRDKMGQEQPTAPSMPPLHSRRGLWRLLSLVILAALFVGILFLMANLRKFAAANRELSQVEPRLLWQPPQAKAPGDYYGLDLERTPFRFRWVADGGFWLAETEVTRRQWSALGLPDPSRSGCPEEDCPITNVNVWDAAVFLNGLSKKAGLETCYELECYGLAGSPNHDCGSMKTKLQCSGFRLPTTQEWQEAAGVHPEPSSSPGALELLPVGRAGSDARGIRGLLGNAEEWTWGDPIIAGPQRGTLCVVVGGPSTEDRASSYRREVPIENREADLGFRFLTEDRDQP